MEFYLLISCLDDKYDDRCFFFHSRIFRDFSKDLSRILNFFFFCYSIIVKEEFRLLFMTLPTYLVKSFPKTRKSSSYIMTTFVCVLIIDAIKEIAFDDCSSHFTFLIKESMVYANDAILLTRAYHIV